MILPDPLTPQWLTSRLLENRYLSSGEVTHLELGTPFDTTAATFTPITVTYSSGIDLPCHLILKSYKPGWHWSGYGEEFFRRELAAPVGFRNLVPVYDSYTDLKAETSYALMADVNSTHTLLPHPLPDRFSHQAVVETLAKMHALWWDHPRISGTDFYRFHGGPLRMSNALTQDMLREQTQWLATHFDSIAAQFGNGFTTKMRESYQSVIDSWTGVFGERVVDNQNLTLLHGDYHLWNLAYPKDPTIHPLYILDWETFKRGLGAYDLAYMFIFTENDDFHSRESQMMHQYFDTLMAEGISRYNWDEFVFDYRLSVIACLFPPLLWGQSMGFSTHRIQLALTFYERWGCKELL